MLVLTGKYIHQPKIDHHKLMAIRAAMTSRSSKTYQLKKAPRVRWLLNKEAQNQRYTPLVPLLLSIALLMDLPLVSLQMLVKWAFLLLVLSFTRSQWVVQLDQHLSQITKLCKIKWQLLFSFCSFLLHQLVWVLEWELARVIMTLHFWAFFKLYPVEHSSTLLVVTY